MKKQSSGFLRFLSVIAVIAGLAFIGVKIYRKFFAKKKDLLEDGEDADTMDDNSLPDETSADELSDEITVEDSDSDNPDTSVSV